MRSLQSFSSTSAIGARYIGGIAILYLTGLTLGIIGLDFGQHWDEGKLLKSVEAAYSNKGILPGWYQYPSLCFWIGLACKALLSTWMAFTGEVGDLRLIWRAVMMGITMLSSLWIFLFILRMRRTPNEALFGAALFVCSFEICYHSRWIAPDAVMMQFGMLCIYVLSKTWHSNTLNTSSLGFAAMFAALACGTKYPGGLFLFAVLLTICFHNKGNIPQAKRIKHSIFVLSIFVAVFIVSTPGIIFDTERFVADVLSEIHHYKRGHSTYGVSPGLEHFVLNSKYLLYALLSPNPMMSLVLSAFVFVGLVVLIRDDTKYVVLLLITPLLYLLYFSSQRVMIVRNLLVLSPFVFILCARGIGSICGEHRSRRQTIVFSVCLTLLVATNLPVLFQRADSIHNVDDPQKAILAFMKGRTLGSVQPSEAFKKSKLGTMIDWPATSTNVRQKWIIFWSDQKPKPRWTTNRPDTYKVIAGPNDLNWSYYPSWIGGRRLLAVRQQDALTMKLIRSKPD